MDLRYKVQGEMGPQGKPHVYFCCCPEDFSLYLEKIWEELRINQDCALWYCPPSERVWNEEMQMQLSRMNLFVMPVTRNLLTKKNYALDQEFDFAIKTGIPVLPLMEEEGLIARYNKKCGGLQFLSPYEQDSTAVSYEKKLKTYLDNVLVGNEKAEQIRKAFDARIFMSYRKKDRLHAQNLMRLIHQNKAYQNIGIWYDEFLIPGEKFSTSISDALKSSEIFALTVTPNLILDKNNYVQSTEFPMALKAGKIMLPVEMQETDHSTLYERFKGLPECAEAKNADAVMELLSNSLKQIKLRNHDDLKEQEYLIGLAYLNGIEMEVDRKKGIELIQKAANENYPEAAEKLSQMYETGDGVKMNLGKAIEWQKKTVRIRESEYRAGSMAEDAFQMAYGYDRLAFIFSENGKLSEAKRWFLKAAEVRKSMNTELHTDETCVQLAAVYSNLSVVLARSGEKKQAMEYNKKALALYEKVDSKVPSLETKSCLAAVYLNLAVLLFQEGKQKDFLDYAAKALAASELLAKLTGADADQAKLSKVYFLLAGTLAVVNQNEHSEAYYLKAMKIQEKLAKKTNSVQIEIQLAETYRYMTSLMRKMGNTVKQTEYNEASIHLYEKILQKTENFQVQKNLASCYGSMGQGLMEEGFFGQAIPVIKKCLKIYEAMQEDQDSEVKSGIFHANLMLGASLIQEKQLPDAEKCMRNAVSVGEKLAAAESDEETIKMLYQAYKTLIYLLRLKQDHREMAEICARAVENGKKLAKDSELLRSLETWCQDVKDQAIEDQNWITAKKYTWECIGFLEKFAGSSGHFEEKTRLLCNYYEAGYLFHQDENTWEAKKYYLKAISLGESLMKDCGKEDVQMFLASSYTMLGDLYRNKQDKNLLKAGYTLWVKLHKDNPDNSYYREMVEKLQNII